MGDIASKLRTLIPDFDTSNEQSVIRIRRLCAEDPRMERVPMGIERHVVSWVQLGALDEAAGMWEANLDWEAKKQKETEEASARSVDPEALRGFVSRLDDPDADVVYQACRDLEGVGKHAVAALPKLIALLHHRDPALRGAAADVIAVIGIDAVSATSALKDAKRRETEDWVSDSLTRALTKVER